MKTLMLIVLNLFLLLLSGFDLFVAFRYLDKEDKSEKVIFCSIAGICLVFAIVMIKVIMNN